VEAGIDGIGSIAGKLGQGRDWDVEAGIGRMGPIAGKLERGWDENVGAGIEEGSIAGRLGGVGRVGND